MTYEEFFGSRPLFNVRDPRVTPALGDRMRRDFDAVQVDVWHLYTENGTRMVGIVAAEKSGVVRDLLSLEEYQLIAAHWRVTFIAGYSPEQI